MYMYLCPQWCHTAAGSEHHCVVVVTFMNFKMTFKVKITDSSLWLAHCSYLVNVLWQDSNLPAHAVRHMACLVTPLECLSSILQLRKKGNLVVAQATSSISETTMQNAYFWLGLSHHRHQHARWPSDVMELLYRFCWTLTSLSRHWAWLCWGRWHYRNLIDWLIAK